ncbi:MAG: Xaa-Pro peptidase family protein [Kiritimatiellaeota bacterium]|nr:Xaa-Pro peptidase family protein [Kiritimatiellota bacterium]
MFASTSPELAQDLFRRWAKIQPGIRGLDADALLVCTPVNQLYLTGKIFNGYIWMPRSGSPHIFVRRPASLTGANVHPVKVPEDIPGILVRLGIPVGRWALEGEELPWAFFMRLSRLSEPPAVSDPTLPKRAVRPAASGSGLLRRARCYKTAHEIAIMREGGARHAGAVATFPQFFKAGMTDQEFAAGCEAAVRHAGSLGLFRIHGMSMECHMGTVLAGDNAGAESPYDFALGGAGLDDSLPVGQNNTVLERGMTVLVDIAYNHRGYLTDCSRTFSIGKPSKEVLAAHQCCVDIQAALAAAAVPGASCAELYQIALDRAADAGYADNFMGLSKKAKFVGHGTGLFINEWPVIGASAVHDLHPDQVVAFEPKIVLPGVGAVGVEDTFVITDSGAENITPCPREIVKL